jgi:hypothetical protein
MDGFEYSRANRSIPASKGEKDRKDGVASGHTLQHVCVLVPGTSLADTGLFSKFTKKLAQRFGSQKHLATLTKATVVRAPR